MCEEVEASVNAFDKSKFANIPVKATTEVLYDEGFLTD